MTPFVRRALILAGAAFLAGLGGVMIGRGVTAAPAISKDPLGGLPHHNLSLDAAQRAAIADLDESFARRRAALEAELRAGNTRLAAAMAAEHEYGLQVRTELERSRRLAAQLRRETLAHLFAIRAALRPDQRGRFDRATTAALIGNGP